MRLCTVTIPGSYLTFGLRWLLNLNLINITTILLLCVRYKNH